MLIIKGTGGETREKQTAKAALGQGPSEEMHTISLSYFADTETPSKWKKVMINNDMLPTSM